MKLPLKFAVRYLFARKSHNVINTISGIGVAGMAIGTAALVVILSVFNGFNKLVSDSFSASDPDLVIRPAVGKYFTPDSTAWASVVEDPRVLRLSSVLEEQVFLSYEGRQSLARVKGLDPAAQEESPLLDCLVDGVWQFRRGDRPMAVCGAALAHSLGMSPRFVTPVEIWYPSRKGAVSLSNPSASLRKVKVQLSGTISVNAELDAKLMLVPIDLMRELLECPTEVSSVEIWTDAPELEQELAALLGPELLVLNRYHQEESVYRMMRYEKLAIYLILIFVVLIIAFNVYSSLKMLVIEKEGDTLTLRSLGAPDSMLRRIFLLEGWLVSLLGLVIGLVLGIALVWLQQRYGLVPMPGGFVVSAYPVVLKFADLVWTCLGVALIGWLMAFIPTRKI